ncbi:MAG: DUF6199 family natural product biosynthesis protein [Jatrophihabitantaceae bacterium]
MFAALSYVHQLSAPATASSGGSHSPIARLVIGVLFVVVGVAQAAKPDLAWRMSRWQFKNRDALQPSNAGLVVARVAGTIVTVVGVVLIVFALRK